MARKATTRTLPAGTRKQVAPSSESEFNAESTTAIAELAGERERPAEPTVEETQARAYEIYIARAGGPGDAQSDWLQAEQDLRTAKSRS